LAYPVPLIFQSAAQVDICRDCQQFDETGPQWRDR